MIPAETKPGNNSTPSRESYFVDNPRFPFCKGCSHTTVLRRLNEALVALQLPPEKISLVTDIGCIGLADGLFKELHTVHTTHGRSTAFATGISLADSLLAHGTLKTIVLIGDGGAMIGLQHLVHAAMLNVDVTVLICNNFVYGMTGGQGSGLTPECFVTATTPNGNIVPPVDLCEILKNSNASFVVRVEATGKELPSLIQEAIAFPGFAAIEVLELCTEFAVPQNDLDGKKLIEIAERNHWKLGVIKEKDDRPSFSQRYGEHIRQFKRGEQGVEPTKHRASKTLYLHRPVNVVVAGSAGERVQSSASMLCQAAAQDGLHITQKNDNPVTQGSGFSLSELWLSPHEIGFTGIEQPDYVVVTSEDGFRELKSRRSLAQAGKDTKIFLEETIPSEELEGLVIRLPFRKVFGVKQASMGALILLAKIYRLVDEESLRAIVSKRFKEETNDLFDKAHELEKTIDVKRVRATSKEIKM
ncbi:MAG: 2-oxoacid:acceptor oxidoreductase family protein [Ignavibacteriales bacterium]|nr:2-oxoacid:acceptor oxidoreductase family protein [Ignavibacteriales bacterium]